MADETTILNREMLNEIVDLLVRLVQGEQNRHPLILQAFGQTSPLLRQITWGGNVDAFTYNLVFLLIEYGEVESGKQALQVLLETVRTKVGVDKQQRIDKLIEKFEESGWMLKTLLPSDPFRSYLEGKKEEIDFVISRTVFQSIDLCMKFTDNSKFSHIFAESEFYKRLLPICDDLPVRDNLMTSNNYKISDAFDLCEGRLFLLGDPGAGKTTALMLLAREAIYARLKDLQKPLPILAPISSWPQDGSVSLVDWLSNSVKSDEIAHEIDRGNTILLLDGLDELGAEYSKVVRDPESNQESIVSYDPRERFLEQVPENNQVIITCRKAEFQQIHHKNPLNGAVTLVDLDDAQINNYLIKHPDLRQVLDRDEQLRKICRIPLLLSNFAYAFKRITPLQREQLRRLAHDPDQLKDYIFKIYVQRRYDYEERRTGKSLPVTIEQIYEALGPTIENRLSSTNTDRYDVFDRWDFEVGLYQIGEAVSWRTFTALLERLHILFPVYEEEDDKETWRFAHLLLRNHFGYPYLESCLYSSLDFSGDRAESTRETVRCLGKLGDSRAIEHIQKLLDHNDDWVKDNAITALGRLGAVQAVEQIISLGIHRKKHDFWFTAREALVNIGEAAIEPLLRVYDNQEDARQRLAIYALGDLKAQEAFGRLMELMTLPTECNFEAAIYALGKLGDKRAVGSILNQLIHGKTENIRATSATALGNIKDYRAIESLVNALDDSSGWFLQCNAILALGQLRSRLAVPRLIGLLKNGNLSVQQHAAKALGEIGDARGVMPLIEQLTRITHISTDVSREVINSLEKLNDERSIEPLVDCISNHPNTLYASLCAKALGKFGEKAMRSIVQSLRNKTELDDVDRYTINRSFIPVFIELGNVATPYLVEWLRKGEDWEFTNVAENALEEMGHPAITPLVDVLGQSDYGNATTDILRKIGKPAVPALVEAVRNPKSEDQRMRAIEVLGTISERHVIPQIIPLTHRNNELGVRLAALDVLGRTGRDALPDLLKIPSDSNPQIRIGAVNAISKVGNEDTVDDLLEMQLLDDGSAAVRNAIVDAFRKLINLWRDLSRTKLRDSLVNLLGDENEKVRSNAAILLIELGDERGLETLKKQVVSLSSDIRRDTVNAFQTYWSKIGYELFSIDENLSSTHLSDAQFDHFVEESFSLLDMLSNLILNESDSVRSAVYNFLQAFAQIEYLEVEESDEKCDDIAKRFGEEFVAEEREAAPKYNEAMNRFLEQTQDIRSQIGEKAHAILHQALDARITDLEKSTVPLTVDKVFGCGEIEEVLSCMKKVFWDEIFRFDTSTRQYIKCLFIINLSLEEQYKYIIDDAAIHIQVISSRNINIFDLLSELCQDERNIHWLPEDLKMLRVCDFAALKLVTVLRLYSRIDESLLNVIQEQTWFDRVISLLERLKKLGWEWE
ncbi:MAG: HEAT repeat domain-containing protein [Candidatus Babeliaceae bacterium]|nr:HEAT repeat domain-containing protein [Candidatus Babeliaceae bacterium]